MQFHLSSPGKLTRSVSLLMGAVLLAGATAPASAQTFRYTDVPSGAYYEGAAEALVELGALDSAETRLRPSDLATRAELAKLMVNLRGEALLRPSVRSFDDVSTTAWYYPYIETSASAGWIRGDKDCYVNKAKPCTARPGDGVNRAEAAALLVRMFALGATDDAPAFMDNPAYEWYYDEIQTAADHCVLQGDGDTGLVRPASFMNRAEMITMFHRAYLHQSYGTDCGQSAAEISAVETMAANKLRVRFTDSIDQVRAENIVHYNLARASDRVIVGIRTATMVDTRTVDLELRADLAMSVPYLLTVRNLETRDGALFNDTADVVFSGIVGRVTSASALSAQKVRLTFDVDIDRTRGDDAWRYAVTRMGTASGNVTVATASIIDNRSVELGLVGNLQAGGQYRVMANDMSSSAGVLFTGEGTFTFSAPVGQLSTVQVLSANRIRVNFSTTLDRTRAEEVSRYRLSDGSRVIPVTAASLLSGDNAVELTLGESLRAQRMYTLGVTGLSSQLGVSFNGTGSTVYNGGSGSGGSVAFSTTVLNGASEVPSVVTVATGTGVFTLTTTGLHYDITVRNLTGGITGAHFHQGAMGVNGPVIQGIAFTGNRAVGTWANLTAEQRNWLLDGQIYVNVHTNTYPNGEVRGQVKQ